MASPSPQLSPTVGPGQRIDRHHSGTPPAQPLSKRDKRRTQLLDRLQEITQQFANNKDQYYRQQLQAIQIDTGLILHADPYRDDPLNDFGEEIQEMVHKASSSNPQTMMAVINGDIGAIAGKIYSEFANEINDAMEYRDAALTMHQRDYERKLIELQNRNAFMIKLAEEEHRALANTLRDRLINSVSGKKARLNREKDDVLNIAESNAILMHPNQFVVANPSSPGGIQGKRATRHRRDMDEIPSFPENHKRKRKAADDIGSPAPTRRHLDNGFSTPIWTTEQMARAANKGSDKPLYSLEKLFTERELHMTYNQAALAAHSYIVTHKARKISSRSSSNDADSGSNDGDAQNTGDAEVENVADDEPLSAPLMDRQYSHATRSTRGAALGGNIITSTGIEIVSDLNAAGNFPRLAAQIPKMPPPLASIMQKGYQKDAANSPPAAGSDELALDLQRMEQLKAINETGGPGRSLELDREVLAAAVAEPGKYEAWLPSAKIDGAAKKTIAGATIAGEEGQGGVPMSKENSMGGSEIGGIPMSRSGTDQGIKKRGRGLAVMS